ncbi:MAG: tetratricopeptide repeat protein [Nitrospiria bacterium]
MFLLFFLFCQGMIGAFFLQPLFSADPPTKIQKKKTTRLQRLQIEAFKRNLRIIRTVDEKTSFLLSILKQYDQNQFSEVLQENKPIFSNDSEKLPEKEIEAAVSLIRGNSLLFLGRQEEAVAAYQRAHQLTNVPQTKAAAMANFSIVLSGKGRFKKAITMLERVLQIDRKTDNWAGQGLALSLLGQFYFQTGEVDKGASAHIESLEIAETVPIPWLEARQLRQLATLYSMDRSFNQAKKNYLKASRIYRKLRDLLGEAASLSGLAHVYKNLGDFGDARHQQLKALAIYQQLEDHENEAKNLIRLSQIDLDQGHFDAALKSGKEALQVYQNTENMKGLAEAEGMLGIIHQQKKDLPEAIRHLEKAKKHFEAAGASQEIHAVDLRIQELKDRVK